MNPDQNEDWTPGGAEKDPAAVDRVLTAVAEHLTANDPDTALDEQMLLVCVAAETYDVLGRRIGARTQEVARKALDKAPDRPAGITRGQFAALLRPAAPDTNAQPDDDSGWGDDISERWLPRIPGPRQEPQPTGGHS